MNWTWVGIFTVSLAWGPAAANAVAPFATDPPVLFHLVAEEGDEDDAPSDDAPSDDPPTEPPVDPGPAPEPPPEPAPPPSMLRGSEGEAGDDRFGQMMLPATRNERALPGGRPEILIVGTPAEVARAEGEIEAINGEVLRRREFGELGLSVIAVDIGGLMTPPILRARLARRGIDVTLDRNAIFSMSGAGRSYIRPLIGLTDGASCRLGRRVRIGLIDGPVDGANPAIRGVPVITRLVLDPGEVVASTDHATGLVALIAAGPEAGPLAGIAPGAEIFSAVAFSRAGSRSEMRLDHLVAAFDWLISERVEVVNMSLAGPRNAVLRELIAMVFARGIILVGATGNDGRDRVSFPAADPHVISVTAVDALKRRFISANAGREVDFAAPGVDVLVPGTGGFSYRSGTSYAAAIATALIAHEIDRGNRSPEAIRQALATRAEDLGRPGRDDVFGWGLIRADGCR